MGIEIGQPIRLQCPAERQARAVKVDRRHAPALDRPALAGVGAVVNRVRARLHEQTDGIPSVRRQGEQYLVIIGQHLGQGGGSRVPAQERPWPQSASGLVSRGRQLAHLVYAILALVGVEGLCRFAPEVLYFVFECAENALQLVLLAAALARPQLGLQGPKWPEDILVHEALVVARASRKDDVKIRPRNEAMA